MSDFSDWLQNNAIDLARLAVQCAILAVTVSYGRKLLRTLRASQEQLGAMLKLSVSDAAPRPAAVTEAIEEPEPSLEAKSFSSLLPEPLNSPAAASSRTTYESEREHSLGGRVLRESGAVAVQEEPSYTPWIAAPAMEPQTVEAPRRAEARPPQVTPSGNPIANWLRAPIRRPGVRRVSPWRKMVHWLQAPAGH